MFVKQMSIFLENRTGRLEAACHALADRGVNILALSLADTADFGILRMIVSDPEAGAAALREAGFPVVVNHVLAVEVEDRPGGLVRVLDALRADGINVEYMYAFSTVRSRQAALVFRFEDNAAAVAALQKAGINVMSRVAVLGQ
ncbi:MAG: ACT domain-containing protein [Candidatus Brocadiaceae bacterium]|nr:ACT domain-containing protein [Candidatus Brocadiaceae bacterium]